MALLPTQKLIPLAQKIVNLKILFQFYNTIKTLFKTLRLKEIYSVKHKRSQNKRGVFDLNNSEW